MGMASLGVGSGLYTASVSPEVLVLALAPALIAILVIAVQATFTRTAGPGAERISEEEIHG